MTRSLPKVHSQYGAPMGRGERHRAELSTDQKFSLWRVRINSGGYDDGGAYWGVGKPLYCYESEDGKVTGYLRANDREDAKVEVRRHYRNARFHR